MAINLACLDKSIYNLIYKVKLTAAMPALVSAHDKKET
jgi:hypothetical protein